MAGLSNKLLWKMWLNQCTADIIGVVELCTTGVQMNWETFLVNELLDDAINAHE